MFVEFVTIGAFLAIAIVIFLVVDAVIRGRRTAQYAVDSRVPVSDGESGQSQRATAGPVMRAFAKLVPQMSGELAAIERDLKRAGYYRSTATVEYLATRNVMVVGSLIAAGTMAVLADPATSLPPTILVVGLVVAVLGYSIPRMILSRQAKRRVERVQNGLPAALDVVTMCLTGGLSLRSSLERVSHEIRISHPDIAVEFDIVRRHADANSMPAALRQFADRVDAPDVSALAALVSQTERLGTHVATAICDFADSVRRKRRQRAEERANKTSIRLLFPVIFCLAPPIYILLCGPPLIKLKNFITKEHQPGGAMDPESWGLDYELPEEYVQEFGIPEKDE